MVCYQQPATQPKGVWVEVDPQYPPTEQRVLCFLPLTIDKVRRGFYVADKDIPTEQYAFDGDAVYDEATGEHYWPAGWYFYNERKELWFLSDEDVTHFMYIDLPAGGQDA